MISCLNQKLIFKHMVDLTHCGCVFCTVQEELTGRNRVYLIFKEKQKAYQRNPQRGNWEDILDEKEHAHVMDSFENAVIEKRIPSFVSTAFMSSF